MADWKMVAEMKQHITRSKRYKLTYAALRKMSYLAGFAEGIAQERRTVDRLNRCAFEGWNRAQREADQLENERDEARRELEELKARSCETCRLAPGCSYCVEGCPSCSEWEAKPEEK